MLNKDLLVWSGEEWIAEWAGICIVEKIYPKAKEFFVNYLKMPEKFTIFQLKLALSDISVQYNRRRFNDESQ